MKPIKRLISLLMILVLLLGSLPVSAATGYRDVPGTHWAKDDIEWATTQGLMNGTGVNEFSPEEPAGRAMLVTVLYRSVGSPEVNARTPFTDLTQDWYKSAVTWAYTNGIVNGTTPTSFDPAGKLTREQLATILYRYTKNTLEYNVTASGSLSKFPDAATVSDWAKEAMLWANAVGLVNGTPKNGVAHLDPQGNATRAQMATIFHRFETYKENNKPTPPEPATTTVPNFIGLSKEQAEAAAKSAGLTVVFNNNPPEQYDSGYRENTVVEQSLTANSTVTVASSIVLKINIAPSLLAIPDLSGMTRDQATQAAGVLGFGIIFTDGSYDENKEKDTALTQTPAAGAMHPKGTVITVAMNTEPPLITFRVASYNVKHFKYGSGINYEVFAAEINEIDPDIIGLQEIDNGQSRSGGDDQMAEIAAATGYSYYYFAKCVNMNDGEYGHGILSKYPITKSETIKFQAQTGEERTVERHEITVNGTTVVFYNTHLCYCGEDGNNNNIVKDQPNQMAEIFELMDLDTYPILVGDMNIAPLDFKEVIDVSRYTPLNGGKTLTDTVNTYPQGTSSYIPIDNIILSDNIGYLSTDTDPDGLTVNVTAISDHNLVYADVYLKRNITIHPVGRVPDLVGMTAEEARVALENKGYQVAYEGAVSDSEATVLSQSVAAGTALAFGETVTLTMMVIPTVPNVVGLTLTAATTLLNDTGFDVTLSSSSDTQSAEAVITLQYPVAGIKLSPGKTVTLTARDPESENFTIASYDVKRFMLEASTKAVDYEAFADEIAALGPDILGLQAVDKDTANGDQTKKIADLLGYEYSYYVISAEDYKDGGDLGNCILSRFPILSADGGLFAAQSSETRSYVRAVVDVNGTSVTVYNTMLNHNTASTRDAQFAELTTMMAADTYPILIGNINMPPADLSGKLDLTAYTPLNGGKDLTQIQGTCYGSGTTYVSNIILSDHFEAVTDTEHPTGLYVSDVANCYHRMIWATIRMKDVEPTAPDLVGLSIEEARAAAEAAGYVFTLAEGAGQETGAVISAQSPAAYSALPTGSTITVNTRVLYGDYLSVANFDVQKMDLTDYAPYIETIRELNPDIIGIQAIDHGTNQIDVDCQLEHLAEQLGYDYFVCGKAYEYKGGYLGNGILSKFPITNQQSGLFESQTTETRGWIRAEINVEGTTVVAYNTKLAHGETEAMDTLRANQFAEINAMMEQDEFSVLMCNLSTDATMLEGALDLSKYTPLNGGKSLENTYITAANGEVSSSNIIISDEFEYMTDEVAAPYGLYIDDDKLCDHVMISAYIRLKASVLPENSRFIEVPDFTGMTREDALALATEKELIATVRVGFDPDYVGKVSAQSIAAGTHLLRGRGIELTVSLAPADPADYAGWLTIASYNVQNFARGSEYDEIGAELRALNADIIGLQEIDHYNSRNNVEQMEIIAEEAGYEYWYFGKAVDYAGGAYGHGILSRYPITKSETIVFQDQYGENRSYERHEIYIDTTDDGEANGYTVAFYNAHLCLDSTKAVQNAQLNEILTSMEADTVPAVLVGDMNATPDQLKDTVDATSMTMLNGGKDPDVNAITCHNGKPIDNIIVSEDWDHFAYDNGLGIMVIESEWSDHNMIYTYLKLK